MIDVEILTAILEEMGYFDDSEQEHEENKEEPATDRPVSKSEQKERADEDEQS
jgi:hypothetical protein